MRFRAILIAIPVLLGPTAFAPDQAGAAESRQNCAKTIHESTSYVTCAFDLRQHDLRLFLNDASGAPYGSFRALKADLASQGLSLPFAMNGGMYHRDRSPVGYYVEGRRKLNDAVTGPGPGNFHMRPNGIFFIEGDRAGVMESRAFLKRNRRPDYVNAIWNVVNWDQVNSYLTMIQVGDGVLAATDWAKAQWGKLEDKLRKLMD